MTLEPSSLPNKSPVFRSCLLVEARHGRRAELMERLKHTRLFQRVVLARSLGHAGRSWLEQRPDACLVGSSISPTRMLEFVRKALARRESSRGVLLVIDGHDQETERELRALGVGLVTDLSSPTELRETLRRTMEECLRENASDARRSTRTRPADVEKRESDEPSEYALTTGQGRDVIFEALRNVGGVLEGLFDRYSIIEDAVDTSGVVRQRVFEDVRGVVDDLFADHEPSFRLERFRRWFESCLVDALVELRVSGREQAGRNFRERVLTFARAEETRETGR